MWGWSKGHRALRSPLFLSDPLILYLKYLEEDREVGTLATLNLFKAGVENVSLGFYSVVWHLEYEVGDEDEE